MGEDLSLTIKPAGVVYALLIRRQTRIRPEPPNIEHVADPLLQVRD